MLKNKLLRIFNFCFQEDQILFCGHCNVELGKLSAIISNNLIASHSCFLSAENVNIDFSAKKIFADPIPETPPKPNLKFPNIEVPGTSSGSEKTISSRTMHASEGWTDSMVKLLIASYSEHKSKFDDPKFTKKKVWDLISKDLMVEGVCKPGTKCDEKWRNLRKTYDKVKSHLNTTGGDRIAWKFYEDFQNIYFKDPYFEPTAVESSSGGIKRKLGEGKTRDLSPGETNRPKKQISLL